MQKESLRKIFKKMMICPECKIVTSAVSILRLVCLFFSFLFFAQMQIWIPWVSKPIAAAELLHTMPPGNKSQKLQLRYVYDITVLVDFSSNHANCRF